MFDLHISDAWAEFCAMAVQHPVWGVIEAGLFCYVVVLVVRLLLKPVKLHPPKIERS